MQKHRLTLLILICAELASGSARVWAQKTSDPNLGKFYMARQQVEILDEAPIVNDRRTVPQPAEAGGGVGSLNRPIPLPKAGWQPYSQSVPGLQTGLPQVNNGVPQGLPSGNSSRGLSGNAGKLGPQGSAGNNANGAKGRNLNGMGVNTGKPNPGANRPAGPLTVQTYKAYKGYGGKAMPSTTSGSSATATYANSTKSSVQGNLLHWKPNKD